MYSFFLQTLLFCVISKITKASFSENDTRNLYGHEQHKNYSFSNTYSNERYYISDQGNKTKYIYPNRRKKVFMHRSEQLPIGNDEQDPRVLKDRNYLASFIQKRYPAEKDPQNLRGLQFLQEYPDPSSVEHLSDIKYASQLEGSDDSTKYNYISSEKNLQDSKTQFQNYRASQPQNVYSFQDPDKPESHVNKHDLQFMKDLYKDLQLQYRSGYRQDKAGPQNISEKASKLILQWAEKQRILLDSFVKTITEVLEGHDSNPNTNRNIPPRDIMLVKDMLMQLFESIRLLSEGSTSTRNRTVLSKWIETQKSLIDSFFQAIQNTNQNVDISVSVNEVMEKLIKNLRELVTLLNDKENFTATEISSSQATTSTYATTTFYLTSTTFLTTHPTADGSTNQINIMENLIKNLRQMIIQINDKNKYSSTTYKTTEGTYTYPTTTLSTPEVTPSHSTTNTYEVTNQIIDKSDSKIKDMFNLIKGLEALISQLNMKPNITRTTNLTGESSSTGSITSHPITTTKPKTVTTYSLSTTSNIPTAESTLSHPTTNNHEATNHNVDHKFKIMENLIKDLKGLINQLSGKENITSTTHTTEDNNSSQPNDTTHSSTERSPSHPVTPHTPTTSTIKSKSTISYHSSRESTSSHLSTTLSTTGITNPHLTTNTYDHKDQINGDDIKILKDLIKRLSELVDLLTVKNDIKSTTQLTTESTFYSSIPPNNSTTTTTAQSTFSTTESTANQSNNTQITDTTFHFPATTNSTILITDSHSTTPYLSTTEASASQFNDAENINRSTQFTAESTTTNPIITNNPTTITTTTFKYSTTVNTASHLQPSTTLSATEGSTTSGLSISHSTTTSQTGTLSSYKNNIENILELLKKLRKIQKTLADKSQGKLSPKLISRVKAVLKQIVAGNVDSSDSAELEILLSTTVTPNEDIADLTMEKLLELFDDFERMYNVLLDGSTQSTTQSTIQNNDFSTTHTTILPTTQSTAITSPTQNTTTALTTPNPNTSTTVHYSTPSSINNLGSDVSNNRQPIVDAIQQLKMSLYHDFYAFKKSQEERMEQILKLLSGKPLDRRTKTIAKPRTIRNKGSRNIQRRNGGIKEDIMHHNDVKFRQNREKENEGSHMKRIPKILNSASLKIKRFPLKLSGINLNGGLTHLHSKRRTNKQVLAMHQIFPKPLSILPQKETYSKRTSLEPETNTVQSYKLPILDIFPF